MSQAKVDYHKEQKKNRQQIMRREKLTRRLEITILLVALVALLAWFSIMVYRNTRSSAAANGGTTTELDLTALEDYFNTLDGLGAEETDAAE